MAYTETLKEKEKRLAYYAKNKADAKVKEDNAEAETVRKFNETTNTDISKNTNPMGDTYKKGGKIMKKMADGGDVDLDAYVRKTTGLTPSKNVTVTPEKTVLEKSGPTANINEIVRQSMGEKNYKEPKATKTKEEKNKYTGPEFDINDLVKTKLKAGGKVKSASSRADGCAIRGKTRA
jgi:hypothetical protein